MKTTQVTTTPVLDFATVVGLHTLVKVTVGPSLEPVLLSLDGKPDYALGTGVGRYPTKPAGGHYRFRIHYRSGDDWLSTDLPPTHEPYYFVQPLPDGQWLLVRGRAADEHDANAHVHSAEGRLLRSFHAGDAIEDVQTTERGQVWVSYFDEGVFGHTPLGTSGLACLDRRGKPLFRFTDLGPDPLVQKMADCYALNVCSDDETWLYYYTDFPLVRLVNRRIAGSWRMPIAGSRGFAVDGKRVLLGGSYKDASLFLGDLGSRRFAALTPVREDGKVLKSFRPFGRRHHLYLATADSLHVVDLRGL